MYFSLFLFLYASCSSYFQTSENHCMSLGEFLCLPLLLFFFQTCKEHTCIFLFPSLSLHHDPSLDGEKSYQISRIMSFYIYNCYFFLSNLQEHTRISPFPFPLSAPRSFLRTGRTKLLANSTFPSIGKAIVN